MGMQQGDAIIAPSRGSKSEAKTFAAAGQAKRLDDVYDYIDAVYDLCGDDQFPDASIVIAQSVHETSDPGPWQSDPWNDWLNPAGMGITFSGQDPGFAFATGEEAARAQVSHLMVYAIGPADAGSRWFRRTGTPIKDDDPRYDAYVNAFGNVAKGEKIEDFGSGVWAVDPNYAEKWVGRGNAIYDDLPDQEDSSSMPPTSNKPVIVLDAGHRSTDQSGNAKEMSMTDDLARAYQAELQKRGYETYWYQEDLDKDSVPDWTVGNLNTVAKGLGAWLGKQEWALMLSLHYNGPHSPLHAIVPDIGGLKTAYPEGRDPKDTAANNALDCTLGRTIINKMAAAGLGSVYPGKRLGIPGLMSELDTGVAIQHNARLAIHAATCPSRITAVRLVIEHGGTDDPAGTKYAAFARAAADAIDAVYGKRPSSTTTPPPSTAYPPRRVPAPDTVSSQGHKLKVNESIRFMAVQGGRFKTGPSLDAPDAIKTPYRANKTYTFGYVSAEKIDGEHWLVAKSGSWAPAKNFSQTS